VFGFKLKKMSQSART